MRRGSGFSVIEAVLTVFIFSLILSALAYSLGQLSRVSLSRQDFGLELEVVQLVSLIRDDAMNARQAGVGTDWIQFTGQNTDLSLATRMEHGMSSPSSLNTVRYRLTDGWLYRTESDGSGADQTYPMAEVLAFEVESSGRLATLKLSYQKLNKVEKFEARVKLP